MIFTIKQNGKPIYKIQGQILPYSYFKHLASLTVDLADTKTNHELIEEVLRTSNAEWTEVDKESWSGNFDNLPLSVINKYIDMILKVSADQTNIEIEQEKN